MRIHTSFALLFALVGAAGCTEPLTPLPELEELDLAFQYWNSPFADSESATIVGGEGSIAVWGPILSLGTRPNCGDLRAFISPYSEVLQVHVVEEYAPAARPCERRYELVVEGLPPGRHRFQVYAVLALDWGLQRSVFDGTVEVH